MPVVGSAHPRWKGGRSKSGTGYITVAAPEHHRATKNKGHVFEHVLVAEKALGKPLLACHPVHHVNEIKTDNRNANLVICEDKKYHALLHMRTNILRAGGNPNTDKICCSCRCIKLLSAFSPDKRGALGVHNFCKSCSSRDNSLRYARLDPAKKQKRSVACVIANRLRRRKLAAAKKAGVV
jgi:HNH endonuclease